MSNFNSRLFYIHLLAINLGFVAFWFLLTFTFDIPGFFTGLMSFIPTLILVATFLKRIDWHRLTDRKHSFYRARIGLILFGLFLWTGILLFFNLIESELTFIFQSLGIFMIGFLCTFGMFYRKVQAAQEDKMFIFVEKFEETFGNSKIEEFYAGYKSAYSPSSFNFHWKYRDEEVKSPSPLQVKDYIQWFREESDRSINDDLVAWNAPIPKVMTLDKSTELYLQEQFRMLTGQHWELSFDYQKHMVTGKIGVALAKQGTEEATYPSDWNHVENPFKFPLLRVEGLANIVSWNPTRNPHLKTLGSTGFGKSYVIKALCYHAAIVNHYCEMQGMSPFFKVNLVDIVKSATAYYQFRDMPGFSVLGGEPTNESLEALLELLIGIEERRRVKQKLIGTFISQDYTTQNAQKEVYNRHGLELLFIDEHSAAIMKIKGDKKRNTLVDKIVGQLNSITAASREAGTHVILASQDINPESMPKWLRSNIPITLTGWLTMNSSIVALGDGSANDLPVTDVVNEDAETVHGASLYGQPGDMSRSQVLYLNDDRIIDLKNRIQVWRTSIEETKKQEELETKETPQISSKPNPTPKLRFKKEI